MNAGNLVDDHFRDVTKMTEIGSLTTREIDNIIKQEIAQTDKKAQMSHEEKLILKIHTRHKMSIERFSLRPIAF